MIEAALDAPPPARVAVGGGSVLYLAGWAFHPTSRTRRVALRLGETETDAVVHSMPRLDVYGQLRSDDHRPVTAAYTSGFWALVPLPGAAEPRREALSLVVETAGGDRDERPLGEIELVPGAVPAAGEVDPSRIAICMATYDPPLELFRRQVESIRDQVHVNWHCVITDDGSDDALLAEMRQVLGDDRRFELHVNERRLGFYWNFAAALERVPPDAGLIALADQDDAWHPEKLARLAVELTGGATLAYSDQRIVDPGGRVIQPTFWQGRRNQWEDLGELLTTNTMTGASMLFRRELLSTILPFPPRLNGDYHDHWIALAARCAGEVAYVDEALYDYVQHGEQVLGRLRADDEPAPVRHSRARQLGHQWQFWYFAHVLPQQAKAIVLLERCGDRLSGADRRMLRRLASGDGGPQGIAERLRRLVTDRTETTLGYERRAAAAVLWRHWASRRTRRGGTPFADERHAWLPADAYADHGPG